MRIPTFTAEVSLYKSHQAYSGAIRFNPSSSALQPAFFLPRGSCWAICGGDPDCVACCLCVRHGGHPRDCCF